MNVRVGTHLAKSERTEYVSGNYFSTFGVGAYAGRMVQPSDDVTGAAPVAVLSYAAWQSAHAADPNVVGSTFFIQSHPVTIVGIAPPRFFGDRINDSPPAFWIPLNAEPVLEGVEVLMFHAKDDPNVPSERSKEFAEITAQN